MNAQTSTTTNEPHPADCLQETGCEECYQAEIAKAGHGVASGERGSTPAPNRVLVLWGAGMLAAHELPEAKGGIGFKVLVADPNWLDTSAPAAN